MEPSLRKCMARPARGAFVRGIAAAAAVVAFAHEQRSVAQASPLDLYWYARRIDEPQSSIGDGARHRLAAASLIKLLIAFAIVEEAASTRISWNDVLPVRERDVVDGSPTFANAAGRKAPVDALMFAMLSQSDNTAANVLLGHAGFARCNDAAKRLGLTQTSVERRFYDWRAQRRGFENYSSPRDMGELLARFAREASASDGELQNGAARVMRALYRQEDRETIPTALPARRIANKTGELPQYRHDAAVVGDGHARYVIVVMSHFGAGRAVAVDAIRHIAQAVDKRERTARDT